MGQLFFFRGVYLKNLFRFSVTQWASYPDTMKLWVAFGCFPDSSLLDIFNFRANVFNSFSSTNNQPVVRFENSATQIVKPGQTVYLTLRISNRYCLFIPSWNADIFVVKGGIMSHQKKYIYKRDSPLCSANDYLLAALMPNQNWATDLQQNLFLNPGETCFLDFAIDVDEKASGDYQIPIFIRGISHGMNEIKSNIGNIFVTFLTFFVTFLTFVTF